MLGHFTVVKILTQRSLMPCSQSVSPKDLDIDFSDHKASLETASKTVCENDRKIKTFPDKQKSKEFITPRPVLPEMLKESFKLK